MHVFMEIVKHLDSVKLVINLREFQSVLINFAFTVLVLR